MNPVKLGRRSCFVARSVHLSIPLAILAVAFCAQLNILQWGVLFGTLSVLSVPIDRSRADVWVASRDVLSLELGHPIPQAWEARVASQPEV